MLQPNATETSIVLDTNQLVIMESAKAHAKELVELELTVIWGDWLQFVAVQGIWLVIQELVSDANENENLKISHNLKNLKSLKT